MQVCRKILSLCKERKPILMDQVRSAVFFQLNHPPKKNPAVEMPEQTRLRLVEKVPQYGFTFKTQKRLRLMRGPETIHNYLVHQQFGIIALTGGRLKHCHFEVMRFTLNKKLNKNNTFAVYRVDPPWFPVTKKSQGKRMGGGKANIHHYCTPIKAGRVLLEVGGNCQYYEVKNVLKEIAHLMPFEAMAVSHEELEEMKENNRKLEEDNVHPWTWKYIVQNNIWGCQNWIKPIDYKEFNKHV